MLILTEDVLGVPGTVVGRNSGNDEEAFSGVFLRLQLAERPA
jgi:hypothetical protein